MKLFLISQDLTNDYDTYDSAVVAAVDEDDARKTHPRGITLDEWEEDCKWRSDWVSLSKIQQHVKVEYLGETEKERGVICASFNAG